MCPDRGFNRDNRAIGHLRYIGDSLILIYSLLPARFLCYSRPFTLVLSEQVAILHFSLVFSVTR